MRLIPYYSALVEGLRHQRRRSIAALACLLWVLGFEAAPNLHIGFHNLLPHHHHGSEADDRDNGHDNDQPGHGDNSIEHRGLATLQAPATPIVVAISSIEFVRERPPLDALPQSRQPRSVRVRGPPLLS